MEIYLGFHGLGAPGEHVPTSERPYWVPVDHYHAILGVIANATNPVGLTFDDGNKSDIEHGLPALLQHRVTASFFVVTERIGDPNYLSAADIFALDKAGMTIGSHGSVHVRWSELPDDELSRQVSSSIATLSDILGKRVDRVAIPFGAYDGRVLSILHRMNIAQIFNSDFGPALPGARMIARNSVRIDTSLAEIRAMVEKRYTIADNVGARLRQWRRSQIRQR